MANFRIKQTYSLFMSQIEIIYAEIATGCRSPMFKSKQLHISVYLIGDIILRIQFVGLSIFSLKLITVAIL